MRYDLTVPLSRYYSNNVSELPSPFKALQMGNVWRADRPQRGRFRQFMQCDIDILGEPGNLAEIELILATTATLGKLSFQNFTVCINDRNILKAMAAYSGFREEDYDEVFIILDKMDKIGAEGVAKELEEMTGRTYSRIHIVGGGSNAGYLNELTAKATKKEIHAGPGEATAIGNITAQMLKAEEFKTIEEARTIIHESFGVKVYK